MAVDLQRALLWLVLNALLAALLAAASSGESPLAGGARRFARRAQPASDFPRLRDVGGLARAKELVITRMVVPLRWPRFFVGAARVPGLPRLRGALFWGAPGTGKTMLARAIANEARVPLLQVRLADVEGKYFGEASKNLRAIFAAARRIAPAVLFLDEVDGMLRRRAAEECSATYGLKTELLQHLDALDDVAVLVIACTNCPLSLDAAVARRLPNAVRMDLPSRPERVAILEATLRQHGEESAAAAAVALATAGCSGSDLAQLVQLASCSRYRRALLRAGPESPELRLSSLGPLTAADWTAALAEHSAAGAQQALDGCRVGAGDGRARPQGARELGDREGVAFVRRGTREEERHAAGHGGEAPERVPDDLHRAQTVDAQSQTLGGRLALPNARFPDRHEDGDAKGHEPGADGP